MKSVWLVCAGLMAACGGDDSASGSHDAAADGAQGPPVKVVYLNFDGVMLTPGVDDSSANTTSLITAPVTFQPFFPAVPNRQQFLDSIKSKADAILAPYNVELVTTRPTSGTYMMEVFSGKSEENGDPPNRYGNVVSDCTPESPSQKIETNFETNDTRGLPADKRATYYAFQAVSQVGIAYGVPIVKGPVGDCMCWADSTCYPTGITNYANAPCTLHVDAPASDLFACPHDAMIDVPAQFEVKLGLKP